MDRFRNMKAVLAILVVLLAAGAACSAAVIEPLGLPNSALGGGALNQYTPGVENGKGLNNIGLLVRTWGKVTYVNAAEKYFYIDDGSGLVDESGHLGIRVFYDNLAPGNTFTPPSESQFVTITGISTTVVINGKIRPMLRPRKQSDMQVF